MEAVADTRIFTTFERSEEFTKLQQSLLLLDPSAEPTTDQVNEETKVLDRWKSILDEYQEQAYLLDRYLDALISPVVDCLKTHVQGYTSNPDQQLSPYRLSVLAELLFHYVKFRGYKVISRHFPHEVADVPILLRFIGPENTVITQAHQWPLRYALLLWMSLLCMVPFDLAQFDSVGCQPAAEQIEQYGREYLGRPGVERDSAVVLLSRFYRRKDGLTRFNGFLQWAKSSISSEDGIFQAVGILSLLADIAKTGAAELVRENLSQFMDILYAAESKPSLSSNTIARKLLSKLRARVALRLLPPRRRSIRRGLPIGGGSSLHLRDDEERDIDDATTEIVEGVLEKLFESLEDKDTVVRWSSAKNIGRISERLPSYFTSQIFETILGLYSTHFIAAASLYDLPSTAEAPWHGACLGCAEMITKGLVNATQLEKLMPWLFEALFFDIRKGSHSIGSKVRDAAAYVVWALAKYASPTDLQPYATSLAKKLVTVSLYDREVHIRRAASAAFQEHVGRTSLFPHGIDVLRMTDFYAVSLRRNAFLSAADQVAGLSEYRQELINHLTSVALRHWDPTMRRLGSQSLQIICKHDLDHLVSAIVQTLKPLLGTGDISDTHGALLGLIAIAEIYRATPSESGKAEELFSLLNLVPSQMTLGIRNSLITEAACDFISATISEREIDMKKKPTGVYWRGIIEFGLKHRSEDVQQAVAHLKKGTLNKQQSLGRVLGAVDYGMNPKCLNSSIDCLVECTEPSSTVMKINIEARRNCYTAMSQIVERHGAHALPAGYFMRMYSSLVTGLEDYTMDERGDVGSWIRMACMRGLGALIKAAYLSKEAIPLRPESFHEGIAGILKQGMERLDNVRHVAGEVFMQTYSLEGRPFKEEWCFAGEDVVRRYFDGQGESQNDDSWGGRKMDFPKAVWSQGESHEDHSWSDSKMHFPKAVWLLDIAQYREAVLRGIVISIGSKTDITQRYATASLVKYSSNLAASDGAYSRTQLLDDLLGIAKPNLTSNNVVIPVLQTLHALLEEDILTACAEHPTGVETLKEALKLVTWSALRLKNLQRISQSMKITCQLVALPCVYEEAIRQLLSFLSHPFPKVRAETAEYFYFVLQGRDIGKDVEPIEEILLETEWVSDADANQAIQSLTPLLA